MGKKTRLTSFLETAKQLEETPKGLRGTYTLDDINADIADEELKQEVIARYRRYIRGKDKYEAARLRLMALKADLQNILDEPFVNGGLISKSLYWYLSLDPETNAIVYQDNDRNYKTTFEKMKEKVEGRPKTVTRDRKPRWGFGVGNIPKSLAPSTPATTPQTPTPQSTPASTPNLEDLDLADNPQAFLDYYRNLPDIQAKYAFYRDSANFTEEEQRTFYSRLSIPERATLWNQLETDEETIVADIPRS